MRSALTAEDLAAWGPPDLMVSEMAPLYILHPSRCGQSIDLSHISSILLGVSTGSVGSHHDSLPGLILTN